MAKIIAVDDQKSVLQFIESALSSVHEVILHEGSANVEQFIEDLKPDLVLLDVVMPQRNGYEVLRSLRRRESTKNIPVLVISSKGEPMDIEWGRRQGANGYLTKPFDAEDLRKNVQSLLWT